MDTAKVYGSSEKNIGKISNHKFKVITKIPKIDIKIIDVEQYIKFQIFESLKLLKVDNLYAVLLHDSSDLIKKNGFKIYECLNKLKKSGIIKKIGISIYNPEELDLIVSNFQIDLVQCPFNIFDTRMVKTGYFKKLKKLNIEIHVRSIFLQGLLLMNEELIPNYFLKWKPFYKKWYYWLDNKSISPVKACIDFAKSIPEIDKIIVGVDSAYHLKSIINFYNSKEEINFPDFTCDDINFINPQKWKL